MECGVQVLGVVSGDKKVKKLIFSKKGGPKLFKILIESMKVVNLNLYLHRVESCKIDTIYKL